jgi:hypothetical protein
MAPSRADVIKVVKIAAPIVGPPAAAVLRKVAGERQQRRTAHDMARQRNGKVGTVTFLDGERRWVVVDRENRPLASVPRYGDGSRETLTAALEGVDLEACTWEPG